MLSISIYKPYLKVSLRGCNCKAANNCCINLSWFWTWTWWAICVPPGSLFIGRGNQGNGSPPRSVLFGSHQVWMLVHRKYTLVSGAHFVEGHQLPSTIPIWASEHHFNCREWQRILVATKMVPFYALLHRSSTGKVVVTQRRSKWRIQVIFPDPPMRLSSCCDPLFCSLHPNLIIQLLSLQWNVLSAHSVGPNVSAPEKDPSKIVLSVSFSNRTQKNCFGILPGILLL